MICLEIFAFSVSKKVMLKRLLMFLSEKRLLWPAIAGLAVADAALLYLVLVPDNARQTPLMSVFAPAQAAEPVAPAPPSLPPAPPPPPPRPIMHPPSIEKMLQSGTLIVVSKASQRMFVFVDGRLWKESPVSTGKKGHETPIGVFPVLQKRKEHFSNLYDNAPMPFMQRLTWDGIALHAGRVPGYAASHGCVRIPHGTAEELFKMNNRTATTVVIGDAPLTSVAAARTYALTAKLPIRSTLAPEPPPKAPEVPKVPSIVPQLPTAVTPGAVTAKP